MDAGLLNEIVKRYFFSFAKLLQNNILEHAKNYSRNQQIYLFFFLVVDNLSTQSIKILNCAKALLQINHKEVHAKYNSSKGKDASVSEDQGKCNEVVGDNDVLDLSDEQAIEFILDKLSSSFSE